MSVVTSQPAIAVVIATCDRENLLAERALPAVVGQSYTPDYLVVVDDSQPENRPRNREIVRSAECGGTRVTYLENSRTQGASGSWNTALKFLHASAGEPSNLFVAILDDDDSWAPDYLQRCFDQICERNLDMVAADIHRIEANSEEALLTTAPETLCAAEFLTSNPGIQGSNLFVRLSVLLSAGGFDEELRSTTDRDLCIRIADLGTVNYERLAVPLVQHFAESGRKRLSIRGSEPKLEGLTSFWKKYAGRMTMPQQQAFNRRARNLFGWAPESIQTAPDWIETSEPPLIVGVVANNERPDAVEYVVHQIAEAVHNGLIGLDVVLLEAGRGSSDGKLLDTAAQQIRNAGAGCYVLPVDQEYFRTDNLNESLERGRVEPTSSEVRKMLEICVSCVAAPRKGVRTWLIDGNACVRATGLNGTSETDDNSGLRQVLSRMGAEPVNIPFSPPADWRDSSIRSWLEHERIVTAEQRIRGRFCIDSLRLLGCGSEGVVFCDGTNVYKCIDYWKSRIPNSQLNFLSSQVGRWNELPGLYGLRTVEDNGPWAVLTYDYEPSTPYRGGHEDDLIQLLDSCRRAGIICNNIHPKNLVVTDAGVKLIDYGADIQPLTPLGFEHMARRAFVVCHHPDHDDLRELLRSALSEPDLAELRGFDDFRKTLEESTQCHSTSVLPEKTSSTIAQPPIDKAPTQTPIILYVGIISGEAAMVSSLLRDLGELNSLPGIAEVVPVVLENGNSTNQVGEIVEKLRRDGLTINFISEEQQRRDAARGSFGDGYSFRPPRQVGIAQARTMLQRYLGELLRQNEAAFGWILDDDMRVDERARTYLRWLPIFRKKGVDALIGHYEGSSPNPPLNGVRVQLVDLYHNLAWLQTLDSARPLPDRSSENQALRAKYPDYYYDLSRRHTGHLEAPHWLEPAFDGESVRQAYDRLVSRALSILSGTPVTRPLIAEMPADPIAQAKDSVNRGGNTIFLNHRPLTATPNSIMCLEGREARRSDMIWAVVNRYYRGMTIKKVGIPIYHRGRFSQTPHMNPKKVIAEIVGSAFYGSLTEFLNNHPDHKLDFSADENEKICTLFEEYLRQRLHALELNFFRIRGLTSAIQGIARPGELEELFIHLERWFTTENFAAIREGSLKLPEQELKAFLSSLQQRADDYASGSLYIGFLHEQLQGRSEPITESMDK